nr:hypothetical protein [Tuwongella immobilis]
MILNFLFIPMDLGFELLHRRIHRHIQLLIGMVRNEVVFVFRAHLDFNRTGVVLEVDNHLNHRQPIEVMQEVFRFFLNFAFVFFVQIPMSDRDFHLHDTTASPKLDRESLMRPGPSPSAEFGCETT